jgi:hypothetical protein
VIGSGTSAIFVRNPPGEAMTGNLIGGNTVEKENVIEGSGGPAIQILEEAEEVGSWTEITRNHGSGNGGPFINLLAGANEGIAPPTIVDAQKSSVTGTSLEGATIRVFSKAKAEAGEVQGFLGETEADGSGNWKLTYSAPAGALVTATQTNGAGSTSQFAAPVAVPADPSNGGNGGGSNRGGPAPDTTAPKVTITKAPKAKSTSTTAKFKFKSNEAGSKFQCRLDKAKFKTCRSPKTYKKLKPGKHVFKVRATDKAGNVSKPMKRKFTVLK